MILGIFVLMFTIVCLIIQIILLWKNETRLVNECCESDKKIKKLQSILFTIGEIAVSSWCDNIVGLVDRTLPEGFKISKEEHYKNLEILKKKKNES